MHDLSALLGDVGREEYTKVFINLRRAFPDALWTMEDLLTDEESDSSLGFYWNP
jgi:hypothetical protein